MLLKTKDNKWWFVIHANKHLLSTKWEQVKLKTLWKLDLNHASDLEMHHLQMLGVVKLEPIPYQLSITQYIGNIWEHWRIA